MEQHEEASYRIVVTTDNIIIHEPCGLVSFVSFREALRFILEVVRQGKKVEIE